MIGSTLRFRTISALAIATSLTVAALPSRAAPPPASPRVERLQAAEQSLAKDTKRLKLRQNLDKLVADWRALAASSEGAERVAALEGEARAWALLAHWSGTAADRAEASRAKSRAAGAVADVADARGAKPRDGDVSRPAKGRAAPTPSSDVARAKPAKLPPASLVRVELETSELGVELVLPAHAALEARREHLPGRRGQGARVYFDVSPVVAARAALVTMPIDHPAVKRVRVGQFDADTVRFVFDLPSGPAPEVMAFAAGDAPRLRLGKQGVGDGRAPAGDPLAALLEIQRAIDGVAPGETAAITPESRRALEAMVAEIREGEASEAAEAGELPDDDTITIPLDAQPTISAPPGALAADVVARAPAPIADNKTTRAALDGKRGSLVRIRRVVIDAGHGGKDGGATGKRGTKEKDVNLAIARALATVLEQKLGVDVVLTRNKDTYLSLGKRVEIANRADADLFISVHSNAHRNRKYHGIETYYLNTTSNRYANRLAARENQEQWDDSHLDAGDPAEVPTEDDSGALPGGALGRDLRLLLADLAMRSATDDSRRLAGFVQSSLVGNVRRVSPETADLGVKHALFYVLLGARMPSILVESGFLSHPDEEKRLADPAYQRRLAEAMAAGIARFIDERNQIASRL